MSEVKVDKISPRSGTDVTLGDASDTFTIPASATLTIAGTINASSGTATGFAAGFDDVVSFTSTQAYTIPADITKQLFYVTGSGGGGGGSSGSYNSTSGGSGGTVIKKLALAAGSVIQITVGAAGTGGAGSTDGTDGADVTVASTSGTSFTTLTGPAGQKGQFNDQNVIATTPSGGDVNIAGGGGQVHGQGAASYWGQGGAGGMTADAAQVSLAPGSGGGGGSAASATSLPGAAGAVGIVVIYLYK